MELSSEFSVISEYELKAVMFYCEGKKEEELSMMGCNIVTWDSFMTHPVSSRYAIHIVTIQRPLVQTKASICCFNLFVILISYTSHKKYCSPFLLSSIGLGYGLDDWGSRV
jgi:hypothetical protein